MKAWWVRTARPDRGVPLRFGERPDPAPGPRGSPGRGARVRGVPHRPAPGRRRPAAAPPRRRARPRGGRRRRRARARAPPLPRGRADRHRLAARAPAAAAASASAATRTSASPRASPAGTPTAATPSSPRSPEDYAYRIPEAFDDERGRAAAVRGDHRLPGPAPGRPAAGRAAGHLRVRRLGPPGRAGRPARGRRGARDDPRPRPPAGWRWSSVRPSPAPRTTRRPPAGRRDPLRSGRRRWCPPALRRSGPRGHARGGRHPPQRHPGRCTTSDDLFQERQLRSVTANTRADGEDFLALAARHPLRPTTVPYPLAEADRALADLAGDRITGAAVLEVGGLGEPVAAAPVLSFSEQIRPGLGF